MRKVVKNASDLIDINEINDHSIIGIQWASGVRCIIIHNRNNKFYGLNNDCYCPSTRSSYEKNTKLEYIENIFEHHDGSSVFVFESTMELLKWFSK